MEGKYFTIVTDSGTQKMFEAINEERKVNITEFAVGDGGGVFYNPTTAATSLKNEIWRGSVNACYISPESENLLIVESVIPYDVGGFTIREMGIFDEDGILIAICNTPDTQKVRVTDGVVHELALSMEILLSNTDSVQLIVDPNVVVATKKDLEILSDSITEKIKTEDKKTIDEANKQSKEYINKEIEKLIGGAPETMDTLKEIADVMAENRDVVEALNAAIGNKANEQEFAAHKGNANIHVTASEKQKIAEITTYQKKESVEGCIFGTLETGELQEILEDSLCFTGNGVLGSNTLTKLEVNGNAESYTLKWATGTSIVKVSDLSGTEVEIPVICMYKYNMYCYDVREALRHIVGEKISSIRVKSGTPVHVEILTDSRGEIVNLIRKIGHTPLGIGDGSLTEAIEYLRKMALMKTGGTVNGLTEFQQGTIAYEYIHSNGTGGFLKLATFNITGDGLEFPVEFHLSELGFAGDIYIRFIKNESMTEYNVTEFTYSGNINNLNPHIHKAATDTWDLYVWIRGWSAIAVSDLKLNKYMIQRLNNGKGIIWHYGTQNVFEALPTSGIIVKANKATAEANKILDRNVLNDEKYMSFAAEDTNYNGSRLLMIGDNGRTDFLFTNNGTAANFYGTRNLTQGTANLGTPDYKWANIYASTSTITTSDKTEKKDIKDLDETKTIDFIMGLQPKSFKFINGSSGRTHHGMISDQVEALLKELGMSTLDFAGFIKSPKTRIVEKDGKLVEEVIEGEYTRGLRYEEFISDIVKMLQIIWEKSINQEKENEELKLEMSNMKQELEELKNKVR